MRLLLVTSISLLAFHFSLPAAPAHALPVIRIRAGFDALSFGSEDLRSEEPGESLESSFLPDLSAAAQTDWGLNRARAFTANDGFEAFASSEWIDVLELGGSPLAPGGVISVDFRIDGSWASYGEFEFIAGIYPAGFEAQFDDAITLRQGSFRRVTNCGPVNDYCFFHDANVLAATRVGDSTTPNGTFDESFTLTVPYVVGASYAIVGQLITRATLADGSSLDAFSSATVERILIPPGAALTSQAGALDAYHVTVPEPATALWAAALGALIAGLRVTRQAVRQLANMRAPAR